MKTEIKDRWIEKLESDEYEQTTGELKNDEGYCCLGVLCEVAVEDGIIKRSDDGLGYVAPYTSRASGEVTQYRENSSLPRVVADWAGLPDGFQGVNPLVPFEDTTLDEDDEYRIDNVELSELNDTYKLSFPEIAKLIKDNL